MDSPQGMIYSSSASLLLRLRSQRQGGQLAREIKRIGKLIAADLELSYLDLFNQGKFLLNHGLVWSKIEPSHDPFDRRLILKVNRNVHLADLHDSEAMTRAGRHHHQVVLLDRAIQCLEDWRLHLITCLVDIGAIVGFINAPQRASLVIDQEDCC